MGCTWAIIVGGHARRCPWRKVIFYYQIVSVGELLFIGSLPVNRDFANNYDLPKCDSRKRGLSSFLRLMAVSFLCLLMLMPCNANAASPSNPGLAGLWEYPTAEMPGDGKGWISYSDASPFRTASASLGLFPWLEFNLRLTEYGTAGTISPGFGHPKEKALDFKLLLTEQELFRPAIAVGALNIAGPEIRKAYFAAGTWKFSDLALTVGYASDEYNGLYGGISWEPAEWVEFKAEYSPLDYTKETVNGRKVHPEEAKEKYNLGIVLKSEWGLNGSLSWQRGEEFCFGLSYTFDMRKPVFGGKIKKDERLPLLTDWAETDIEKMASELQSELAKEGFGLRNTVVLAGERKVHIAFENIGYSSQTEALARTVILAAESIPWDTEICSFSVMIRGVPAVRAELNTQQLALIRMKEFNSNDLAKDTVSWAPNTRYGTLPDETWNTMAGPGKSITKGAAEIRIALAYEPRIVRTADNDYMSRLDIDYIGRLRSSDGWEAYLKIRQPIENDIDIWRQPEISDKTRIWKGVVSYAARMDNNWWAVGEAGWLDENYFGANLWARWYPDNSPFWIGGRLSVVKERDFDSFGGIAEYKRAYANGKAFYDPANGDNDWVSGYWAEAGYHDSNYDADLTVRYGRFIDSDEGYRIDAVRRWDDASVGFYFTDTERDSPGKSYTDAGMMLHIPLSFWYAGHTSNTYWDQEFSLLSNSRLFAGTIPGAWMSPEALIGDLRPQKLEDNLAYLMDRLMRDAREKGEPSPEAGDGYGLIQYLNGTWRIGNALEGN